MTRSRRRPTLDWRQRVQHQHHAAGSATASERAPIKIGNASGFYGDRLAAMREMLEGGELDVLTGDYLAELTMLILGRDRLRDPSLGYARTFLRQLEDCLGLALAKGVTIVANAGGLNPKGLAACLQAGADVVVTGRVTDASLVVGPAAARFGWRADDFNALAGAMAAGH